MFATEKRIDVESIAFKVFIFSLLALFCMVTFTPLVLLLTSTFWANVYAVVIIAVFALTVLSPVVMTVYFFVNPLRAIRSLSDWIILAVADVVDILIVGVVVWAWFVVGG
jgi:hypothetical protein